MSNTEESKNNISGTSPADMIAAVPEMQPSAEDRRRDIWDAARWASLGRGIDEHELRTAVCNGVESAYRDGYAAALSALSPLIEAAREVTRRAGIKHPESDVAIVSRECLETLERVLAAFPAPATSGETQAEDDFIAGPEGWIKNPRKAPQSPADLVERAREIISEWLEHDLSSWLDTELAELRELIAAALAAERADARRRAHERCAEIAEGTRCTSQYMGPEGREGWRWARDEIAAAIMRALSPDTAAQTRPEGEHG